MFSFASKHFKHLIYILLPVFLLSVVFVVFFLLGKDSRAFHKLCSDLCLSELSGDTLSLHYTLAYPEDYGISCDPCLPCYQADEASSSDETSSLADLLSGISPDHLSAEDAYTYDLLTRYLALQEKGSRFAYYPEPLSPSSGMQSGLPILLSDYTFRSAQDVEDYLALLDQTDEYFGSLAAYEKEKAAKGLFMSDPSARKIITQCTSLMDPSSLHAGDHFLCKTFEERLNSLLAQNKITPEEKEQFLSENDRLLTTVMAPAYERLADSFTLLSGSGSDPKGLCALPDGKDYYAYLLERSTGSFRSISELKSLLFADFQQNYTSLLTLLQANPDVLSFQDEDSILSFPSEGAMLADLQAQMRKDFPAFPKEPAISFSCKIKRVSPAMEPYCSPAYYLTPPVDDLGNNIIYINHRNQPDSLTLYTTLAHEGYPGHLYQTVYSQLCLQNRNAPLIRSLLHYGGYVEGWALYVEDLSYSYAASASGDSAKAAYVEACRLNRNLQLSLYSLLDIAIHHDGADLQKTSSILSKAGITDPSAARAIYEYIAEEPATYPKYYVGFLELCLLKQEARTLWGQNYSDKLFHQFVLETGPSDFTGLWDRLALWEQKLS